MAAETDKQSGDSGEERLQSAASNAGADGRNIATPAKINIAIRCALKNNVERFRKCFDDEEDPFFEKVSGMLNERDDSGKSPIDIASLLGRTEMLKELIERGAEVDVSTVKGSDFTLLSLYKFTLQT